MTSVQLYETSVGTVDANGNLVLTISGPRRTRTWQGSLTIVGCPAGTQFSIAIGAQVYGTMNSPGPAGTFQLLIGQSLTATATGLTVGLSVTGILAGRDDPKELAIPWLGPTLVTSVNSGGP